MLNRSAMSAAAYSEAGTAFSVLGTGQEGASMVLLEAEIPVHVKQADREEVYQPLGVAVSIGKGGVNGISKCVVLRLTDPKDAFFLFSMTLLEDDYGRFKERHELNVDFNGFPRDLVAMLSGIGTGGSTNALIFVCDSKEAGTLRIVERTEFRALEHLSLAMARQGDVGQKKYLAERFQHFQSLFLRSESERKDETMQYEGLLREVRGELAAAAKERDELRDRSKIEASCAASSQLTAVAALKDQHSAELRRLAQHGDEERNALHRKIDALQEQLSATSRQHERDASALKDQLSAAHSTEGNLRTQLRLATERNEHQDMEIARLRADNTELLGFRTNATKSMSESELNAVASAERLRHLTESLKARDEELKSLREQQAKHDKYVTMLTDQLSGAQEKLKTSEASLAKAHHILGTQVQAIKAAKEKSAALRGQLDANETLLGEKNNTIERLRGDMMTGSDRHEHLQSKVSELKDQLLRAEEQNSKLTQQLKMNEDALVHMQRMSTGFGTRTFASAAPALSSYPSGNLYRQFQLGSTSSTMNTGLSAVASASSLLGAANAQQPVDAASFLHGAAASASAAASPGSSRTSPITTPQPAAATSPATADPTSATIRATNVLTQHNSLQAGIQAASLGKYASSASIGGGGSSSYPMGSSAGPYASSVSYVTPAMMTGQAKVIPSERPSAYFPSN